MHRINLHGPWIFSPVGPEPKAVTRQKFPCLISCDMVERGQLFQLSRKFHAPTGLGARDQVFLSFEFNFLPSIIDFNGKKLEWEKQRAISFEVGTDLAVLNEIRFEFEYPNSDSSLDQGVFAAAALEIKPAP